ncbi:MAG: ABC transporter ATP-binding protein [Candidatus Rokubacteria bacterium]|nr:ABC transporter ATP-binding protein [Candidatus Rokubacteria bacterium]MBI2555060.1 ABC transporter ATP-binding protein [Candidatus Rokubacteria bacterium]
MLAVEGLSVFYGDLPALREVSFEVRRGEVVALIGPNGAGKTTTLKVILGLLTPRSGEVSFERKKLGREPSYQRVREGIALVPEGRRIFPDMTVEENLELGAYAVGNHREQVRERLERVYALFPRLYERRRQLAGTFSGGEQQMLAIGRALMSAPKLLMLDEPSLGLAPRVIDALYDHLQALHREGLTILLVEQFVYGALEVADRGYVLERGTIVREGTGSDLLHDDYIQRTYLAL